MKYLDPFLGARERRKSAKAAPAVIEQRGNGTKAMTLSAALGLGTFSAIVGAGAENH